MIAVLIPASVGDLDEAQGCLAEAPRQQALAAKVTAFAGADGVVLSDGVALQRGFGFLAEIEQLRCLCLHAEAEFHRLDEIEPAALHDEGQMMARNVADRRLLDVLAFTPMGVPPKTAGNWAAAYSEGFAVLKLMKPGKF